MKKLITLSLISFNLLASQTTSSIEDMFNDAEISGEIRTLYSWYNNDNTDNTYATAIGGSVLYKLANYNGFSGAIEFRTSKDIKPLTGDNNNFNDELSSSKSEYTQLSQSYISYDYKSFNLTLGRQILDTPLADSDDVRMIPNSFEAYIASYELSNFNFIIGNVQKWQGCDASLEDGWIKTAPDGTNLGGIVYQNDSIEANLWYYNITKTANAIYADISSNITLSQESQISLSLQYLDETELENSGISATIYGISTEFSYNNFAIALGYNHSIKDDAKSSFSGFGGGALYTSMDSMILDEITQDRDADAYTIALNYNINKLDIYYAYGDFKGDKNSLNKEEHIIEHNFGLDYAFSDNVVLSSIYVIDDNKENSSSEDFNSKNLRFFASYSF